MLNYVIYGYFILGFLLIIAAPMWKIFKKAGKSGWTLLIPGYNIVEFGRVNNVTPYLSAVPIVSILCILGMPFLAGVIHIEDNLLFFFQLFFSIIFCFYVLTILFFFPFLSVSMCAVYIFLQQNISPGLAILKIIFLLLIILELAVEISYWLTALNKMRQPLWQLAFPFLPLLPLIVIILGTELGIAFQSAGSIILGFAVFLTLLADIIYLYYLGFSVSVKY